MPFHTEMLPLKFSEGVKQSVAATKKNEEKKKSEKKQNYEEVGERVHC